jgi:hypothetical protein
MPCLKPHVYVNQHQTNAQNLKPSNYSKCDISAPLYLFVFLKKKLSNMEKIKERGPLSIFWFELGLVGFFGFCRIHATQVKIL